METEVFNRSNTTNSDNSKSNNSKRVAVGAAAATVGVAGAAAVAYGASQYINDDNTDNPDNTGKQPEFVVTDPSKADPNVNGPIEEAVAEVKPAEVQPAVTQVTNNHYHTHNHYEKPEPKPEPEEVAEVHVFHHGEPVPQFGQDHIHVREEIVSHNFNTEPDIHITKNIDIVQNHIHVHEPIASPVDIIANDVLAQGEFVDPTIIREQHLDIVSIDSVQTIDGHNLTSASFASPAGDDMYLVDIPNPNSLTVPEMIDPIVTSVVDEDPTRYLAHDAIDIIGNEIGGDTGDMIQDVNNLIGLV